MKQNSFDPLNAQKVPPENCGYGIRFIQLDQSMGFLNIRQNLKNTIEFKIPIKDIVKPILPQITMEIIKAKKSSELEKPQNVRQSNDELLMIDKKHGQSISQLAKVGMVNKKSDLYR